jgi:hypothetical protein
LEQGAEKNILILETVSNGKLDKIDNWCLGDQIKKVERGRACSMRGRYYKYIQNLGRPRYRWEDNVKIRFIVMWIGFI